MRGNGLRHQIEGLAGLAAGLCDVGAAQQEGHALGFAQGGMGARRGRAQAGQGALAQARRLPVGGDAAGFAASLLKPGRYLTMRMARQHGGDAGQHRFMHQVVRKGRAAQHLAALQLGPGVGHGERRLLQHHLGQADREINPGDGRHARQLQRRRAERGQRRIDQLADVARARQHPIRQRMAFGPGQLQGLQREQRIAAAACMQQRRQQRAADAGQGQRIDHLGQCVAVQRRHLHGLPGGGLGQLRQQPSRGAAIGRRAQAQQPGATGRCGTGLDQLGQHLQRGVVSEVQVVQHHAAQRRQAFAQHRRHGIAQGIRCSRQRRCRAGQLGQHRRQVVGLRREQSSWPQHLKGAQGAAEGGIGHQGISGTAGGHKQIGRKSRRRVAGLVDRPRPRFAQGLQQARLAHAGFTHDHGTLAGLQHAVQLHQLEITPDQAGRAHQGRRQGPWCGRAWPRRAFGRLDGFQQRQRFGRRACADLVLEALLAIVKGAQCRGAVTGQVKQPHQAAVRVLAQRVECDQRAGHRHTGAEIAAGVQRIDALHQVCARQFAPLAALGLQPGAQFGAGCQLQATQQSARTSEVVSQACGQRQLQLARHQVEPDLAAQAEQALAQRGARAIGRAVGPQQPGQAVARRGPIQGQPGQQQGIHRGQRLWRRAVHGDRCHITQAQASRADGHGAASITAEPAQQP